MTRKSKRRKRRDKRRQPEPALTYRERSILEEQDRLVYDALCSRIGISLAGRRKPADEKIVEKLRRTANEFENRTAD